MSVFTALYNLVIGPLELFFEILFAIANRIFQNPGVSIIFLSLAMNFLVLPLYKMADAIQAEEQATEARLRPWVTHIKKTFKGDERFMILQTYYRQNGYKPTDPLKGSISLLLEIPFFMAAYQFLSRLQLLQGCAFGPIANLGAPDGLLVIGGVAINLLPILMTAINLISSAIYTKGASLRSKIQLYVMAGLFLVLLYDSPSGLVFYWTLNNLFSLIKNLFMKVKNPKMVFCTIVSTLDALVFAYVIAVRPMHSLKGQIMACALLVLLQLLVLNTMRCNGRTPREVTVTKQDHRTFFAGALFLTVLTGVMIPTTVIHASPQEFMSTVVYTNPLRYILSATLTAAGIFLVWAGIFYLLANPRGKKWMGYGICALCVIAVIDYMFFGRNYGNMSSNLIYDVLPMPGVKQQIFNLEIVAIAAVAVYFVWKYKPELGRFVLLLTAVASLGMSAVNMAQIHGTAAEKNQQLQQNGEELVTIPLSREGRNVVVLMLDRGISGYVPFLFNEKPELQEQFAGFTYYPNTVSFGAHTNFGSPALFGGYEYTPERINLRDTEPLEKKQDEALSVMPLMFSREGFVTTVCDPPCAGYDWIPDLSLYQDYPEIRAFRSMGQFDMDPVKTARRTEQIRSRNFFCYSLFRTVPACLQPYFYDEGRYNELASEGNQADTGFENIPTHFLQAYTVLENLSNITEIREGSEDTFLMMTNDTTHEPTFLQEPDYVPAAQVNNALYDAAHTGRFTLNGQTLKMKEDRQVKHYHINMAAFLKLGAWFDFLRSEGLYDNTRIIIVSDHGSALGSQIEGRQFGESWDDDVMFYNPLLLVKDFGSTEYRVDNTFMTNADTPELAMKGVIRDFHNPFTGNLISSDAKFSGPQKICCSHEYDIGVNNGTTFLPGRWFSVHDNIFDMENWEYLGVE